jgi:hypothetical protein
MMGGRTRPAARFVSGYIVVPQSRPAATVGSGSTQLDAGLPAGGLDRFRSDQQHGGNRN